MRHVTIEDGRVVTHQAEAGAMERAATLTPPDVLAWIAGQIGAARTSDTWTRWQAVRAEIESLVLPHPSSRGDP